MSTCDRCGISAWHPEARSCTAPDCELRGHTAEAGAPSSPPGGAPVLTGIHQRVADRCQRGGLPITAAGVATVARCLIEENTPVHANSNAIVEARDHA